MRTRPSRDCLCEDESNLNLKVLFYAECFIFGGSNRVKRLKDYKVTEQIPRLAVKVFPMQFDDEKATRRIVLHHARYVILQHNEGIQKLAYK